MVDAEALVAEEIPARVDLRAGGERAQLKIVPFFLSTEQNLQAVADGGDIMAVLDRGSRLKDAD